jgi:hypothetical protein
MATLLRLGSASISCSGFFLGVLADVGFDSGLVCPAEPWHCLAVLLRVEGCFYRCRIYSWRVCDAFPRHFSKFSSISICLSTEEAIQQGANYKWQCCEDAEGDPWYGVSGLWRFVLCCHLPTALLRYCDTYLRMPRYPLLHRDLRLLLYSRYLTRNHVHYAFPVPFTP